MTSLDDTLRLPRSTFALVVLALIALALFAGFIELGNWQVHRLAWKRDLIARVDARVHLPAQPAPGPAQWATVSAEQDEYRHVSVQGQFLHDQQTLIWAATDRGSGYWVVTPLRAADGSIVLVNRGFVLPGWCGLDGGCPRGPAGTVTVNGLLRMSEPMAFLRHNDPMRNSWYTRDVPAIAKARGLAHVAPYFVDADADVGVGVANAPQGGLTVVSFPNNHLTYLITWYLMALGTLLAAFLVGRDEYRVRLAVRGTTNT